MTKLRNYLSCLLMFTLVCAFITSCSSESGEPSKVVLGKGESAKLTMAANTSSGSVNFNAASSWSAYTSTQSRGTDGVEWIHLNITNGQAGEVSLTFTLDRNDTGANRTAYIIIVCEDEKLVITVTQTTEMSEDESLLASSIGYIDIEKKIYNNYTGQGYTFDGTINYRLEYVDNKPIKMRSEWRDDMDVDPNASADQDLYCINSEIANFVYEDNGVMVDDINHITYYPSKRTETESSQHYAELKNGNAVKGWYKWDDDDNSTSWEAIYNSDGYLTSTKNNDGTSTWDTYTYSWKDGCLQKIVWTSDIRVVFTYADPNLKNLHRTLDLNWVLPLDLECYDFAAGDITRMFATTGLMGEPSALLLTTITEYYNGHTYSYRMNYEENTKDRTVVTVMRFVDDVQESYSEWTINYKNII